jgi:hypothetical protein
MPRKADYGVKFVGYSADVIARKDGREVDYARLDFASGAASMYADGGRVVASKRGDLEPFLKSLPNLVNAIQVLQATGPTVAAGGVISLSRGLATISVRPDTEINRFVREVTKRFAEIEQVLEQAENIGLSIRRQPYNQYINEIAKTGISRVECHGLGLFVDGRLIFYPNYQVVFVRPASV